MIHRSPANCQTDNYTLPGQSQVSNHSSNHWKTELAAATLSVEALLNRLAIPQPEQQRFLTSQQVPANFPVRVTESFIQRMRIGDIDDPLLKQVAPLAAELVEAAGYTSDPLQESSANPVPGVIHKYYGRVLLVVTRACAIHCRYCFRRHFPYDDNNPGSDWLQALQYLGNDMSVSEVILSGGDPLAASDGLLEKLCQQIAEAAPHIQRLRIHSRLPVVLPSRITQEMLAWLNAWQGQKVLVIHCNHPSELDKHVERALAQLASCGVTLLNQTVLLRGVNDCPDTLVKLSERLFGMGVMPYYLHSLDPVAGAHHFEVSQKEAKKLIAEVSARLPGYLVPKMVEEPPGARSKRLL